MRTVLILLLVQGVLGAVDTLWHHEKQGLPTRASARREIGLHAVREALYAVVFLSLGWLEWRGAFALILAAILLVEIGVTLADFLEEDRTRALPPTERLLHTVMAIVYGVFLAAFAPVLIEWAQSPTAMTARPFDLLSGAVTLIGLGVLVWAVRDGMAYFAGGDTIGTPMRGAPSGRTVLITGATGFIGRALTYDRLARGDRVVILARDRRAAAIPFGGLVTIVEDLAEVPAEMRLDDVINLAGAPTAGGLWTRGRKAHLLESRVRITRAVVALMARLETTPPVLISASAVGFYGDRGEELLDEGAGPQARYMSDLCRIWEEEACKAETLGARVCLLRLGLIFDWDGGPLPMLTMSAAFGVSPIFGGGDQHLPWMSRADVVRAMDLVIRDGRCAGPLNLVTPPGLTQAGLARRLAPFTPKVPAILLRAALGDMADLFLAGQRVSPARLIRLGFSFAEPAIEDVLARRRLPVRLAGEPIASVAEP